MNIIIAGSIGVAEEILRVRDALLLAGHEVGIPRGVKVYESGAGWRRSSRKSRMTRSSMILLRT